MKVGGRPAIGPPVTVRLPAEVVEHLDEMARQKGVSRAEIIRDAIQEMLWRHAVAGDPPF